MPSRRAVALILLFWLATAGYVAYRDLGPRLFASGPPPMSLELEDEATQNMTVQWTIYWNDRKSGQLRTYMKYRRDDDTFQFHHQYSQLKYSVGPVTVSVPIGDRAVVAQIWRVDVGRVPLLLLDALLL